MKKNPFRAKIVTKMLCLSLLTYTGVAFGQNTKQENSNKEGIDKINVKVDQISERLTRLENMLSRIEGSLNRIEKQITTLHVQLTHVDKITSWFEQPPPPTNKNPFSYTPAP
jgi:septal ring factor EnvC (AmiA/AmiB activator)